MAKVDIKICMGTMCYVMGGAELKAFVEMLPEDLRQHISVGYSPCLGPCGANGAPPYIEVNGKTVAGVSKMNLLQIIKETLNDVI